MSNATLPLITGDAPAERLASLRAAVPGRIVFTTSFGLEDQALTHVIFTRGLDIEVVTLDTGIVTRAVVVGGEETTVVD